MSRQPILRPRACMVGDCGRAKTAKDRCFTHYTRWRHGEPDWDRPVRESPARRAAAGWTVAAALAGEPRRGDPPAGSCPVDVCGKDVYAKGLCRRHYMRQRRAGRSPEQVAAVKATRVARLAVANRAAAAVADAERVRLARLVLASGRVGRYEAVLRARVDRPAADVAELAAGMGMTRSAYASALRRALAEELR